GVRAAGLVPPLAVGVECREAVREARGDLAIDETAPFVVADTDPIADLAPEHQLGDLRRPLAAAAIHQLRAGIPGQGKGDDDGWRRSRQDFHRTPCVPRLAPTANVALNAFTLTCAARIRRHLIKKRAGGKVAPR